MKRGFKGRRRNNDPTYRPYDSSFHPQDLINLMRSGFFNCEIEDEWAISAATLKRWITENPELKEAYEKGKSGRKAYWVAEKIKPMIDGKLEGRHSFSAIKLLMEGEGEYSPREQPGNSTQININNMNLLDQKTHSELQKLLCQDLKFLDDNNVIKAEYEVIEEKELNEPIKPESHE